MSSCSFLSFPGDSQAGQVSASTHQGLGKRAREGGRVATEAAGQCPPKEERETERVYVGCYLERCWCGGGGGGQSPEDLVLPQGTSEQQLSCSQSFIWGALGPPSERK